jgi:hypothetical protein
MVPPAEVAQVLKRQLSERQQFWKMRRYFVDDDKRLEDHLANLFADERSPFLLWLSRHSVQRHSSILGADPVFSICAGTVCLLISVLLLAISSQPLSIWLPCVVITSIMAMSMTCAFFITGRGALPLSALSTEANTLIEVDGKGQILLDIDAIVEDLDPARSSPLDRETSERCRVAIRDGINSTTL